MPCCRQPGSHLTRGKRDVCLGPLPRPVVLGPIKARRPQPITEGQVIRVFDSKPALLGRINHEQTTQRPECLPTKVLFALLLDHDTSVASLGDFRGRDQPGEPATHHNHVRLLFHHALPRSGRPADFSHLKRRHSSEPGPCVWFFPGAPEWDHEYDGTFHGWDLFHTTLKHYLEHHRGKPANNISRCAQCETQIDCLWGLFSADQRASVSLRRYEYRAGVRIGNTEGPLFADHLRTRMSRASPLDRANAASIL